MVELSQEQQQSYLIVINQAGLSQLKNKAAKGLLYQYSSSAEVLNEKLSARTGIEIALFQAISNLKAKPEVFEETKPKAEAKPEVFEEIKPKAEANPEVFEETKPKAEAKPEAFEEIKPKLETKTDVVKNAAPEEAYKFFSCSLDKNGQEAVNPVPTVSGKTNEVSLLKAIKECSSWAENDQDLYVYNEGRCESQVHIGVAKAMCYLAVTPSNIKVPASVQVTPIYSCAQLKDSSYQKDDAPFTYASNAPMANVDQVRQCADWAINKGDSLAFGEGACSEFYPDPDSALAGCLANLQSLL
jgi:hypothetical protein